MGKISKNKRDIDGIRTKCNALFAEELRGLYKKYKKKRKFEERIFASLDGSPSDKATAYVSGIITNEPFTAIEICVLVSDGMVFGSGFSICDGKDEWDAPRGIEVATLKAVRHAARQIVGLDECSR